MKINVIDDKGFEKSANIITSFRMNKKSYVIYTFNEEDDTNSVRIYISELRIKTDTFSFNNIINNDEWDSVKVLMREMAKGESNIDYVLSNYDVEVIDMNQVGFDKEYTLATIKDSKIVKVSPKFISGLYNTYKILYGISDSKVEDEEISVTPSVVESVQPEIKFNDDDMDDDTAQKMKDIWEYSAMLQKKIAKDMDSLNSKVVKLDGEKYRVNVKDPLYLNEKLDIKGSLVDVSELDDTELLKELEPVRTLNGDSSQNLFNQLEKELSGINDNFNKIVAKNKEKKLQIATEVEKRLKEISDKELKLQELEKELNDKKLDLEKREQELLSANERLEENVKALTKYANMVNSMILNRGEEI